MTSLLRPDVITILPRVTWLTPQLLWAIAVLGVFVLFDAWWRSH